MTCSHGDCTEPAAALVSAPEGMPGAPMFVIVRPPESPCCMGEPMCLDHTHHTVDLMLMRAKEATP